MIPRILFRLFLVPLALAFTASVVRADVTLHTLFTDHMVLQRDIAVPVWGWADDGEKVTVEFRGKKVSTVAKDGRWMVKLGKLKAGGPDVLTVSGKNSITVADVLVGEVWIASGQSNMEWPMRASADPEPMIERDRDLIGRNRTRWPSGWRKPGMSSGPFDSQPDLAPDNSAFVRLYTVPKLKANEPTNNVRSAWQTPTPAVVSNFSAVAYHFGVKLQRDLGVPVGMIHTSWGGSPAEVWMRDGVLRGNPDYKRDILDAFAGQHQRYLDSVAAWEKQRDQAKADGKTFTTRRPGGGWKPSELYNGMIAPLLPYAIKGAIWYQGESNAGRAHQYRSLIVDMIRNWRNDWGQGDFAFLQVQLAPFKAIKDEPADSDWAELREAQVLATKVLPKVGAVSITDYGDPKDIHPIWKRPVGERLARAARGIAYGEKFTWSGPMYRSMKIKGDKIVLSFDHIGRGLVGRSLTGKVPGQPANAPLTYSLDNNWVSAPLAGFTIAGEDRKFVWAKAVIEGDKVIVSSPDVPKPVAVRYGWADCPVVNLYNSPELFEPSLAATPFRTDDWPMITAPKK